ncbi:MAG TPA: hypothetical protein VGC67_13835 [Cellulomonas sp.]
MPALRRRRNGKMSAARRRMRGARDDGAAMVMVIGLILVTAIVSVTVLTATTFSSSVTVSSRAAVEAQAAAEAGIDTVAQSIFDAATCSSPTVVQSTTPAYSVQVSYKPSGYSGSTWTTGCPPTDAQAVRLVSVGTAASTSRSDSQNTRTVEQVWSRSTPAPTFTKAIFGDLSMSYSTSLSVTSAAGDDDADLYTNGDFTCSTQMSVAGSIYVSGNALWSSQPCSAGGDVYVEGNMVCPAGTTIGGNLYVQGSFNATGNGGSPCKVAGDVWVGGSADSSTVDGLVVGGSLLVRGNYHLTGVPKVTGAIRVGGSILDGEGKFAAAYPSAVQHDGSVTAPPTIPDSSDNEFPVITTTSSVWDGFVPGDWHAARTGTLTSEWESNVCNPYSASPSKPITVSVDTAFDTRSDCSSVSMIGLKLVLNADAVIFVNALSHAGDVQFVSGDGEQHSLYIVQPWTSASTTCSSTSGGFTFTYGSWTQDPNINILLYTPSTLSIGMSPSPSIRGQIYACKVSGSTGLNLIYDPVGAEASGSAGLDALTLTYTRDV